VPEPDAGSEGVTEVSSPTMNFVKPTF